MKKKAIQGIKIETLQEAGKLPMDIHWNGEIPSSYSIQIIETNGKVILAVSDSFGGRVAWAIVPEAKYLEGKLVDIEQDEMFFLKERYPGLYNLIS